MFSIRGPTLTEPGVKYFLRETLKQCHDKRTTYYNIIWNCGFFFIFININWSDISL